MQKKAPFQKKPQYSIDAVDNALLLLQLLRDNGSIRLKDAAVELKVAPSTAHRLLAMLVYRGFAVRDESRRYVPGPSMGVGPAQVSWARQLRAVAQPHLELLADRLGETTNLMVRAGTKVRFLSTVEGPNILRVGDRQGTVLPAVRASGGKAMLAELGRSMLEQLLLGASAEIGGDNLGPAEFAALLRELDTARIQGFAANVEGTEDGVSAVGMALHNPAGTVVGAISVAIPAARFRRVFDGGLVPVMRETVRQIEIDIATNPTD